MAHMNLKVVSLLIITIALVATGCKKDLRIKTYSIEEMYSSGVSGTLTMNETNDEQVQVVIDVKDLPLADTLYKAYIRGSLFTAPTDSVLEFPFERSTALKFHAEKTWDIKYDAMKEFDGCFILYGYYPSDSVPLASCNIGKNE